MNIGEYELLRTLGKGGFGEVYLGKHIHDGTLAAIKVLKTDVNDEFINEARTFRLQHPHIIRILDFGVDGDVPFLVMDYAPNGTLRQRHPPGVPVPLTTVVSYVKQIADALQYAHDHRLIHRDVKPENMLIDAQNTLVLSDFGIAAVAHGTASMKTMDNTGTVAYMAPEHIQGKPRPASDQYALAIVVYEWLCGERPFRGITPIEIAMRHLSDDPPSLCQKLPALPPEVEQVVLKALAKDPQKRFGRIEDFAEALAQATFNRVSKSATQPASQLILTGSPDATTLPDTATRLMVRSSPSGVSSQPEKVVLPPQRPSTHVSLSQKPDRRHRNHGVNFLAASTTTLGFVLFFIAGNTGGMPEPGSPEVIFTGWPSSLIILFYIGLGFLFTGWLVGLIQAARQKQWDWFLCMFFLTFLACDLYFFSELFHPAAQPAKNR